MTERVGYHVIDGDGKTRFVNLTKQLRAHEREEREEAARVRKEEIRTVARTFAEIRRGRTVRTGRPAAVRKSAPKPEPTALQRIQKKAGIYPDVS